MAVITISRQYGAGGGGGDEIAARLCDILGYQYFDKRLMFQMASELNVVEAEIIDYSEDDYQVRSFVNQLPGLRGARVIAQASVWGRTADGAEIEQVRQLDESYGISLTRAAIRAAYAHGNVVIVGRGGQVILKDETDVLHVRIEAPPETRQQRVQDEEGTSINEAQEKILNRDQAAAAYLKRFYDLDWDDHSLYDLSINTGKFSVDAAVSIIANAVSHLPQPEL